MLWARVLRDPSSVVPPELAEDRVPSNRGEYFQRGNGRVSVRVHGPSAQGPDRRPRSRRRLFHRQVAAIFESAHCGGRRRNGGARGGTAGGSGFSRSRSGGKRPGGAAQAARRGPAAASAG